MMLESIGMVRPKVDGFFAYRGPVETTNEDPYVNVDESDAVLFAFFLPTHMQLTHIIWTSL